MKVSIKQLRAAVQEQMPHHRWEHTQSVIEMAKTYAKLYGADVKQAEIAALLHDVAKYWPTFRQRQLLEEAGESDPWLQYDKPLWHAPAGAIYAQREFGVNDEAVINAIRYHTSGRVGMTLLERIICLADYTEQGRSYPEVGTIRKLGESSLELALIAAFNSTIKHLLTKEQFIFPLTILARNDLLQEVKNKEK